jgi:carbonic anhydrase
MPTRSLSCALLLLAGAVAQEAAAQNPVPGAEPAPAPAPRERPQPAPPVHAPQPVLPPAMALEHLRQGNARLRAALADGKQAPALLPRPGGAGRYVAAVLVCADAGVDAAALFGLLPKDVLLVSVPGAFASADITALLERAAQRERLSLCVVLTHADCASLAADQGPSTAGQLFARRSNPARDLASARRLPLEHGQALLQKEQILALSESLRQLEREDRFRLVPASVDPSTLAITWHTTRAEELPIAPVK